MTISRVFPMWPGRKNRVYYILFPLLLALSLYPLASEAVDELTITLDRAYSMAFENNERVEISGEKINQSAASLNKATASLLPTIMAEGNFTKYNKQLRSGGFLLQPDNTRTYDLVIEQPIYSGGKSWSARRSARIILERSRIGLQLSKELLMLQTARAYFGLLKAKKIIEIAESTLKRGVERAKVATVKFRVGEVSKTVFLRAEAELAGDQAKLIKAQRNAVNSMDRLKRLIGYGRGNLRVVDPPPFQPPAGDASFFETQALEHRRDYKQALLDEREAMENVRFAKGGFLPSLKFRGVYSRRVQDPSTSFLLKETVSGAFILSYPLFEGGLRRAELSEAKSRLRQAEFRKTGLKRDIGVQIRSSLNTIRTLEAVRDTYLEQKGFAEENYKMVFKQFKYGLATSVDMLDANSTLVSSQNELVNARYNLQLAILQFRYLTGTLLQGAEAK